MTDDLSAVEALYTAALKLAPADRAAFLDEACREHPDRRAEVERLLAAHGAAGAFLEPNAAVPPTVSQVVGEVPTATWRGAAGTASFGAPPERGDSGAGLEPGAVIAGRYRLAERIGEGGMGAVWLAHQTEPVKRSVAVKVIKAGMDSRAVLARFEAERQALALMDHPNIAKVLDAGATADGRPFFVMELVKGTPITEFCDARRLGPRERLELFVSVCQAIQHAHQKGIIHRDIKPSNVLVALYDERPVVKVIDFGVAKATGPGTELGAHTGTGFGAVVGTPEYMSPEQATFNNLDIDTRTDVYALGVLLYELLAGAPPFSRRELERNGLLEMLRVVREEEPPKPSTKFSTADAKASISANRNTEPRRLTALLRGELDWIVMRALDKDRNRRYETANGFAADVLRYLAGEPVQAVPPSRGYRFRKFLKRNKGPALATTLVFAALVCGVAGTALGLIEAKTQEAEAKKQETEANTQKEKAANEAAEKGRALEAVLAREKELAASRGETVAALYDARMLTLREALQSGNVARTRALLDTMRPAPGEPDPRGIEWHAIDNQVHGARTTVVVQPTLDGKRMYALPELYDNGRVILYRQNAPNGYYYDAVAYDPETGNPLAGFEPVRGRYRERQDMNYLRFFTTNAEPGTQFLHSTAPRRTTFTTMRAHSPPQELAVYDVRTGRKVADIPDAVLEPARVAEGWQRHWGFATHSLSYRPLHLERGLCIDVFTRDMRGPLPNGPDLESLVRLRDIKTGSAVRELEPVVGHITGCRFSPDGRHFLLERNTTPRFKPTPDGQPLGTTELSLWEVDSGKRLWGQSPANGSAQFSDNGKTVSLSQWLSKGIEEAHVLDALTGKLMRKRLLGQREYTSPGGRWVARIDGNRVDVLSYERLEVCRTIWTDQAVYQVAFPDDDRLLRVLEMPTTSGARCSTWDLPPLQVPKPVPQVPSRTGTSPFDLDGIFGSQVSPDGKVWLCDVRGSNELTPPNQAQEKEREWGCGLTEATSGVRREFRIRAEFRPYWLTKGLFRGLDPAIEHCGGLIAFPIRRNAPPSGADESLGEVAIAVADFTSQSVRPITPFEKLGTHYHSPTFSPDGGRVLLMHGRELSVRDVRDGREVARVKYAEAHRAPEFATYSPDGRWMVVGSRNAGAQQGGELLVHDAATGALTHARAFRSTQESQKFDQLMSTTWKWVADGRKLAIFFNGEATLWDTETWSAVGRQEVRVERWHRFERVVFADDGSHYASLTSSSTPQQTRLQVTDTRTGRHKFPDPIAFRSVAWVAFTPDSQRLAVLGEDEFAPDQQAPLVLQIWDPHRAQLRYTTKTPLDLSARGLVNGATLVGTFEHGGGTLRLVKDKQTVPDRTSSYVLDARPRTPEQVAATPRPDLVLPQPDANEGPVVFADNRNAIKVLYPQQIRLYTQNPSSASNFADVAVLSQGEAKVRAWREAAKRDPDCAPLQRELGIALRELNRLDESEQALRKALELDRGSAETHFELATVLRARNRPADEIAPLREVVRLDPTFVTAHARLAECLQALGSLDEAATACEFAIATIKRNYPIFPFSALSVYKQLGELHWRRKNYDRAAAVFGEAVPHATYDTNLLVWWSVALRDAGKAREADEAFARAKAANESAAHLARAEIQFHQSKNLAGAAADYRIAAELIKAAGPFNDLGCVLRDQGKTDEAFKAFDRATELDAKLWLPYRNRAYMRVDARQPAKAVPEFDQAIVLCPLNDHTKTLLRTHRATARVNDGQVALGLAEIDEVSKLPDLPALVLYDCACAYGLATGRTPVKKREYGDTAMALLRRAVAGGFVNVADMKRDTDLDPLRDRDDLKALFAELETKQALPVAPAPREPSKWSPWTKE